MSVTIREAPRIILQNPHGLHQYFGWPSIARLQDGALMAVASGFRMAHICPFGKVVGIRSQDEGQTWSAPEILIDTPLDDRDAGILPFGDWGVMITSFNNTPAFQRRAAQAPAPYVNAYLNEIEKRGDWKSYLGSTLIVSQDGGQTFSAPTRVPVSSPHGPCVAADGRILYVGRAFDTKDLPGDIECYTLTPEGNATYLSKIVGFDEDLLPCEPYAIQLKNGRILVHIRVQATSRSTKNKGMFTTYQSVSDDGGVTFTPPRLLLTHTGGAPAHLIEHSSGALISVYGYREAPYGIRCMVSYDNGESWDTDHILVADEPSPDLGYPASVELSDGRILTIYYAKESIGGASVIKQFIWTWEI